MKLIALIAFVAVLLRFALIAAALYLVYFAIVRFS